MPAPPTDRSIEIETEMLAHIKSGEWPIGYRIGTQPDLAARYRSSRSAVNRALMSLADRGLVKFVKAQVDGKPANQALVCSPGGPEDPARLQERIDHLLRRLASEMAENERLWDSVYARRPTTGKLVAPPAPAKRRWWQRREPG